MAGAPGHAFDRMRGQHAVAFAGRRGLTLASVDARLSRVEAEIAAFRDAIERQAEAMAGLSALVLQRLQARESQPLRRRGLGRGLAALLPGEQPAVEGPPEPGPLPAAALPPRFAPA